MTNLTSQPNKRPQPLLQKVTRRYLPLFVAANNIFAKLYAQIGQVLKDYFASNDEPSITQITDREGQIWWRIDDPQTRQTYWCESDIEVMIWLDNRLYH